MLPAKARIQRQCTAMPKRTPSHSLQKHAIAGLQSGAMLPTHQASPRATDWLNSQKGSLLAARRVNHWKDRQRLLLPALPALLLCGGILILGYEVGLACQYVRCDHTIKRGTSHPHGLGLPKLLPRALACATRGQQTELPSAWGVHLAYIPLCSHHALLRSGTPPLA
jgi:hypothetical protein